jgi:ATP-dependent Clp protease, protease subunit
MRTCALAVAALAASPASAFLAPSQLARQSSRAAAGTTMNLYVPRSQGIWMPEQPPDKPDQPTPPRRSPVNMPTVGEGKDQMDVVSRLLKDRILLLGSEVNDEVGNVMVAQLLYLAQNDPEKDITLYINSPGGSVSAGLAIYDTMQVSVC